MPSENHRECPICDGAQLHGPSYAEVLGWYLGDGHLARGRGQNWVLSIINDERYVVANARVPLLLMRIKPSGHAYQRRRPGSLITAMWWMHWPCLFPQHGPGRKHERRSSLTPGNRRSWTSILLPCCVASSTPTVPGSPTGPSGPWAES